MDELQETVYKFMCAQKKRESILNALSNYREDTDSILPTEKAGIFTQAYDHCAQEGTIDVGGPSINEEEVSTTINNYLRTLLSADLMATVDQF